MAPPRLIAPKPHPSPRVLRSRSGLLRPLGWSVPAAVKSQPKKGRRLGVRGPPRWAALLIAESAHPPTHPSTQSPPHPSAVVPGPPARPLSQATLASGGGGDSFAQGAHLPPRHPAHPHRTPARASRGLSTLRYFLEVGQTRLGPAAVWRSNRMREAQPPLTPCRFFVFQASSSPPWHPRPPRRCSPCRDSLPGV